MNIESPIQNSKASMMMQTLRNAQAAGQKVAIVGPGLPTEGVSLEEYFKLKDAGQLPEPFEPTDMLPIEKLSDDTLQLLMADPENLHKLSPGQREAFMETMKKPSEMPPEGTEARQKIMYALQKEKRQIDAAQKKANKQAMMEERGIGAMRLSAVDRTGTLARAFGLSSFRKSKHAGGWNSASFNEKQRARRLQDRKNRRRAQKRG